MRRICRGGQAFFSCITCSVISLSGCKAFVFTGETGGRGEEVFIFCSIIPVKMDNATAFL